MGVWLLIREGFGGELFIACDVVTELMKCCNERPAPLFPWENKMTDIAQRITTDLKQCGGRPCIRGMRIRVTDVLELLASGLSQRQILEELPDLEKEDISACLHFACRWLDHPVLAA